MSKYASDVSNFSFESRQLRASAQMVLNVAQVAKFSKKTNHLGLLVHGGFGLSSLNDDSYNIGNMIDNMAHVVVGITPKVKLTERLTIQLDYSVYGNMLQNKTFDLQSNVMGSGIKGIQSNLMLGLMLVIGDKSPDTRIGIKIDKREKRIHFQFFKISVVLFSLQVFTFVLRNKKH